MRRGAVDVGADDIRLDLVGLDLRRGPGVVDRVEQLEQRGRAVAAAGRRHRLDDPDGGVRVLPAVLAHPRQVALDVAGVVRRAVERRREQADEAVARRDQLPLHGVERRGGPRRRGGARDDGPRLRQGVDAALLAGVGAERRAVVVPAAQVPAAVPGVRLERRAVGVARRAVAGGPAGVAAPLAQRREGVQHGVQEEAHPDALAAPLAADAVHAVVPVARAEQGQPVRPGRQPAVEGAAAVLVHAPRLARGGGRQERLVLARLQGAGGQERRRLVEDAGVAGGGHVRGGGVGEPEQVVGEAGAQAAAAGRVPPVQHVPLGELVRGVQDDLGAGRGGVEQEQRQGVLQLVPVAERAARLVEGGAAPEPAAQRLVGEPPVDQQVEGRRRRRHAHAADQVRPARAGLGQGLGHGSRPAPAGDQLGRRLLGRGPGGLAQQEGGLDRLARRDRQRQALREARLQAGAGAAVELGAGQHGGRAVGRAVRADEGGPVSGRRSRAGRRRRHDRGERHPVGELAGRRVAGQQVAGGGAGRRDDVRRRLGRRPAQDQPRAGVEREPARARAAIRQADRRAADRLAARREQRGLERDAGALVPANAGAEPVAHLVVAGARQRPRQRRPAGARRVVPHPERLAVRVAQRVVGPRREPVQAAVAVPGAAGARLADQEAERLVGDDVDPRLRRHP